MAAVMHDERNPPPVASLDALNASIGPTNGAMEAPRGPEDYGAPPEVPEGMMLTGALTPRRSNSTHASPLCC